MGVENHPALEVQQQMLADGLHEFHATPAEALRPAIAGETRMRRENLIRHVPGEGATDTQRRVMQCVALRHGATDRRQKRRESGGEPGSSGWRRRDDDAPGGNDGALQGAGDRACDGGGDTLQAAGDRTCDGG